jgi:hypothetical protein
MCEYYYSLGTAKKLLQIHLYFMNTINYQNDKQNCYIFCVKLCTYETNYHS